MAQLSTSAARVIDPILSSVAQGYRNNEAVGSALFPYVPVGQRGGRIMSFGKEDFALYNTVRAPGSSTKRVQYGHAGLPFALESHSLEGFVPIELMQEAEAVPGIDMGSSAVLKTQNAVALRLEFVQATLATTAANYAASNKTTLSGTSQWSDFTAGISDPVKDVEIGKEAVRKQTGRRPNVGVVGASVMAMLKQHPKVIDRMKYTGRDVATPELIASLFGLKQLLVGDMVYTDNSDVIQDVWGKSMVLAYTEVASANDAGLPSYGYTYRLSGYPMVEQPYMDRNTKSWVYPVSDEVMPVIASATAGYLLSAVVV